MRTFSGALIVLILSVVSGDDEVAIEGILGDSVLLPCTCKDRNLMVEFNWQMDEPHPTHVLSHQDNTTDFNDRYKSRAKIFVADNSSNCSLLLTNIIANDQGKYRCTFQRKKLHTRFFIKLNISERVACTRNTSAAGCEQNGCFNELTGTQPEYLVIPILLVLGLVLVLWLRWKFPWNTEESRCGKFLC
ncbi:uncharacterized protein si:dkey-192g7.3 [Toxotes jaculatrix]|uniref:uncharacterized protein si:dkey-192g7.3 n=1 Tax=Toxotes jaculatrix TaxID=941984 RepID=UPI001B3AA1FF|nr:uncharacterized protein si:dkey-192g7.3 [Toxotes jaculatrix]